MNISVFGLGYVGAITSAVFAKEGHRVIGVDVNASKVDAINNGHSPIVEAGLNELIGEGRESGRLSATANAEEAVLSTDLTIISVGTPSTMAGGLKLDYVIRTCLAIGHALDKKDAFHTVVIRSTLLPGSLMSCVIPALERGSRKKAGVDFGVAINPEFLREGTGIKDFYDPPFTLIGELDQQSGDLVAELYRNVPGEVVRTDLETAEMVKYVSNAFHALKISFANEIGSLCKVMGLDSHKVMDIFLKDTKLNISPRYLRPGFAFGGSCLPKDLRAILYLARHNDVRLPVLEAILPSNELQVQNAVKMIMRDPRRRVGLIGLSFKPGTDDLRESPLVELVETLIGKGVSVKIYDENLNLSRLIGANKEFIERTIPHISALMVASADEVIDHSDVIVIAHELRNGTNRLTELLRPNQLVIDFVRVGSDKQEMPAEYQGISW